MQSLPEAAPAAAVAGKDFRAYDGEGWLTAVNVSDKPVAPYALVDADGKRICFVSPTPGLSVSSHLNKRVGLYGKRGLVPDLNVPHVLASKVVDLNRQLADGPPISFICSVLRGEGILRVSLSRRTDVSRNGPAGHCPFRKSVSFARSLGKRLASLSLAAHSSQLISGHLDAVFPGANRWSHLLVTLRYLLIFASRRGVGTGVGGGVAVGVGVGVGFGARVGMSPSPQAVVPRARARLAARRADRPVPYRPMAPV